jgi:hypothetical protein
MIAVSHLDLLPDAPPGAVCVVCHRIDPDGQCERCGLGLDMDCFVERIATELERDALLTIPQDSGVNVVLFTCPGCRS